VLFDIISTSILYPRCLRLRCLWSEKCWCYCLCRIIILDQHLACAGIRSPLALGRSPLGSRRCRRHHRRAETAAQCHTRDTGRPFDERRRHSHAGLCARFFFIGARISCGFFFVYVYHSFVFCLNLVCICVTQCDSCGQRAGAAQRISAAALPPGPRGVYAQGRIAAGIQARWVKRESVIAHTALTTFFNNALHECHRKIFGPNHAEDFSIICHLVTEQYSDRV
jgi:hypothetical protein